MLTIKILDEVADELLPRGPGNHCGKAAAGRLKLSVHIPYLTGCRCELLNDACGRSDQFNVYNTKFNKVRGAQHMSTGGSAKTSHLQQHSLTTSHVPVQFLSVTLSTGDHWGSQRYDRHVKECHKY